MPEVASQGRDTTSELASPGRRRFVGSAGIVGLGLTSLGLAGSYPLGARTAHAQSADDMPGMMLNDVDILNFALNLEYLEAEYYLRAVFGRGLRKRHVRGEGHVGPVTGGSRVHFQNRIVRQYALEIALDEFKHVKFLRAALGSDAVARPEIDFEASFTAAAQAAGLIGPDDTFDPFADEVSFLLGAFLFEDVGVTAYKGAARFIENKDFLEAAAGILAVEAYHASNVRTVLLAGGFVDEANAISDARDSLDGPDDLDQGITKGERVNVVPADENAIAFSRSPAQVLNIVYLNPETMPGGFFPNGLNGTIR